MLEKEIWIDINGYEGHYQISNFGRVKSNARYVLRSDGRWQYVKERILIPFQGKTCNYLSVQLCKNNITEKFMIHRLVAIHYLSLDPTTDLEVNHKDGNRHNNRVDNLEVVTHQENIDHSIRTMLKNDYGEKSVNAKLTNKQAKEIRELWRGGMKQNKIAKLFNVSKQTICSIVNNKKYFK